MNLLTALLKSPKCFKAFEELYENESNKMYRYSSNRKYNEFCNKLSEIRMYVILAWFYFHKFKI